jgi:hypothetical protein
MIRIQMVNPVDFADTASNVLRAAWKPPALDYSPEFLRWFFSAPSELPPIATAVFDNDEAVGFVGAVGRRVRFRGEICDVYHSSFYSVRPGPGRGMVAPVLMRKEAEVLRHRKQPFLVFAQDGTLGAQMLIGLKSLGFTMRQIGAYAVYGGVAWPRPASVETTIARPAEWLAAYSALNYADDQTIQTEFHPAEVAHQLGDPWGRQCAVVHTTAGDMVGAAILAHTRSVTQKGIQIVPTLHHIRCRTSDALASLLAAASSFRPADAAMAPIVTIPNRVCLSDQVLRQARVRAMPVRFVGYIASSNPNHPLLGAEANDVEVL